MILVIIGLLLSITGISAGLVFSKRKFESSVPAIVDIKPLDIDKQNLNNEFNRISELQKNLIEIKSNLNNLHFPTPESLCQYDDANSSLKKLSQFFEDHNLAIAGTEQFILSLLPTSQVGQSLYAISEIMPENICQDIFGQAYTTIKEGFMSIPTSEGLSKFIQGMGNLDKFQLHNVLQNIEHHNFIGALLTPIKAGTLEIMNVHDAGHQIVASIKELGADLSSSLECSTSVEDLANVTDVDITGHIPVITIAISSFREFRLLSEDKTDFISSVKNISLDAVGAGTGGALGAKGGAVLGSFICPGIGTVIGGVLGGIAGGVLGKMTTNKVKRLPLENAIEKYESSYKHMRTETCEKSRETLNDINHYCIDKRDNFINSEIYTKSPITDCEVALKTISLSIYQFVQEEISNLKGSLTNLKKSFWYSSEKYDSIICKLESRLGEIEQNLPSTDIVYNNPYQAIDLLINLDVPSRSYSERLQHKLNQCTTELEQMNNKNDAALLIWSYLINQSYQNTLNDIAKYANEKTKILNSIFSGWRSKLDGLENDVKREKAKLGLP